MSTPKRKIAFVLVSSAHGTMIVNRFDHHTLGNGTFGVGHQLLETGRFDPNEVQLARSLLDLRRKHHGDGVVALDCGANIGVHTIEWSRHMAEWGAIIAMEAQERVYYALAGNIALNNCFNARALHAAVSDTLGIMKIPTLDPQRPASFGSLELTRLANGEQIGQDVDYSDARSEAVQTITIDALTLPRCDFIKIDVEGMEAQVLQGATATIAAHRPILLVEMVKNPKEALRAQLADLGYRVLDAGINFLAVHPNDPCIANISTG